eukprot:IDg2641t1
MPALTQRHEAALDHAVQLVLEDKVTLPNRAVGKPPVFNEEQEKQLADTCLHFSLRGIPLVRNEVAQLVKSAYGSLPSVQARFTNGLPGRDWLISFFKRHDLSFRKPSRQEAERYRSTNADTLTSHLVTFQ